MLTDSLWNFTGDSPGQAITASAASTNYVDMGALGTIPGNPSAATATRDLGKGNKIPILIQVTEAFATLTSLKVAIQQDSDSGFGTVETILETEAIALASLVAGYQFNIDFVPNKMTKRYIRLYFTVAGSNATGGKVFASAVEAKQDWYL